MGIIEPGNGVEPIDTLIYQWIKQVTGYDDQHVIRGNQTGKRPDYDYATYYCIGGNEADFAYKKKVDEIDGEPIPDDDVQVIYTTPETIIYDLNIYALDGARKLKDLFKSRNLLVARNILKLGNLVISDRSDVRDLTAFGDTKFRPRYQSDFSFRTMNDMVETNQKILEMTLHGKWGDLDVTIET